MIGLHNIISSEILAFKMAIVFALPFVLTGLTHVVIMHQKLFGRLANIPIDFGAHIWKHRLFGDNKTLRGALVIVAGLMFWTTVTANIIVHVPQLHNVSLVDFSQVNAVLFGALSGFGWLVGEVINSFLKRQYGIPPGGNARGLIGIAFWVLNQIDGLIGAVFATGIFWEPGLSQCLHLLAVAIVLHGLGSFLMPDDAKVHGCEQREKD